MKTFHLVSLFVCLLGWAACDARRKHVSFTCGNDIGDGSLIWSLDIQVIYHMLAIPPAITTTSNSSGITTGDTSSIINDGKSSWMCEGNRQMEIPKGCVRLIDTDNDRIIFAGNHHIIYSSPMPRYVSYVMVCWYVWYGIVQMMNRWEW
jgi:hypothetical protein